ncbi:MAG: RNA polymerase sigma factor [candidate division WOR-3 bacterium]|nr:MAG: RNA polymerase sigma factor [candidate division WOR-3 bacterium]
MSNLMQDDTSILIKRDIGSEELANLIEEGKHGDDNALGKLCAYIYSHVYAFLFYRVSNPEDAEDLTSEVVLKITKALKKQRGNFHAWMYRIARNRLVDYYRQRAVRQEVSLTDIPEKEIVGAGDLSKQILTKEKLRKGLGKLTEEQKQVIVLKFIQGYNNQEVADIVGKSVGAVKVLQFRALRAMREYFSRRDHEPEN